MQAICNKPKGNHSWAWHIDLGHSSVPTEKAEHTFGAVVLKVWFPEPQILGSPTQTL